MSELGRYSLYFSIILNLVKYWIRLEKSDNILLKESLRMSKNSHENGCTSWIICIYNMLQSLDISPHYILQGKLMLSKLLIIKLTSINGNVWKSDCFNAIRKDSNQNNKLRTFRLFKSSFYFESLPYSERNIVAKFTMGVPNLEIVKGRHNNLPEHKRICILCNCEIEDEIYFVMRYAKL